MDQWANRLVVLAAGHDPAEDIISTAVGSEMSGSRPKLHRLPADGQVRTIVLDHWDQFIRLRAEHILRQPC